jgi:polysaccharide export outer membrane protein
VLETELSVLEALAKAGGHTTDANLDNVLLLRREGNRRVEKYLDLEKALSGEDYAGNIQIQSGDILYVPPKAMAKVGRYLSYVTSILSPIILVESGIVMWPLVKDAFDSSSESSTPPSVTLPTGQ